MRKGFAQKSTTPRGRGRGRGASRGRGGEVAGLGPVLSTPGRTRRTAAAAAARVSSPVAAAPTEEVAPSVGPSISANGGTAAAAATTTTTAAAPTPAEARREKRQQDAAARAVELRAQAAHLWAAGELREMVTLAARQAFLAHQKDRQEVLGDQLTRARDLVRYPPAHMTPYEYVLAEGTANGIYDRWARRAEQFRSYPAEWTGPEGPRKRSAKDVESRAERKKIAERLKKLRTSEVLPAPFTDSEEEEEEEEEPLVASSSVGGPGGLGPRPPSPGGAGAGVGIAV